MKSAWQEIDIRLYAAATSLLLSLVCFFFTGIPNDDAYVYIRTAEIFQQQGLAAAIDHYGWPTYPVLIALLGSTGLSLLTAAYLVNALFYALLVYSFVSIVRLIDDSRAVVSLAALTVLVYPELNEYREMVIRDIGFWSLSLFGLWQFLLFDRERNFNRGVYFMLALGGAALFRAEAVLYLLFTPFSLLLNRSESKESNRSNLLRLLGISLLLGGGIVLSLMLVGINLFALLGDRMSTYQMFLLDSFNPPEAVLVARSNAIFGEFAAGFSGEYVTAVITVGLLVVLFMTLFYAIGGPYFWLLVWGWFKNQSQWSRVGVAPVAGYMLVNLILLLGFLYLTRFLSARYAIPFALMVVLQVPFLVNSIVQKYRGTKKEQTVQYFLVLFFFYCAIDAYISFGKPKDWITDAGEFLRNSQASTVVTNNRSLAYYSGKVEAYDEVIRQLPADAIRNANPGDLIAIELFFEMRELVSDPAVAPYLDPVATFADEETDRVVIFTRVNP